MRIEFEKAVNRALNEVDYYYYGYGRSRSSLAKIQEKYSYDLKISDYYKIRYENGASELADWLNALNVVTNSRLSTLDYRYRLIQQENLIYKAMAGRYEEKQGVD
jgi:outer membrane protein TolC